VSPFYCCALVYKDQNLLPSRDADYGMILDCPGPPSLLFALLRRSELVNIDTYIIRMNQGVSWKVNSTLKSGSDSLGVGVLQ